MNKEPSKGSHTLTRADAIYVGLCFLLIVTFFFSWLTYDQVSPIKLLFGDSARRDTSINTLENPFVSHRDEARKTRYGYALVIAFVAPICVRLKNLRPWIGILVAITTGLAMAETGTRGGLSNAGILACWTSLGVMIFATTPAVVRRMDLGVQRLNSRKADVSSHTFTTVPGVHFSGKEFYERLEKWVGERNWPGVELLHVPYTEAGAFSHKREYLRVIRHRQVIDFCAAPFGTDYFFSMREAEIKPPLSLAHLIGALILVLVVLSLFVQKFGWIPGMVIFGFFAVLGALLLFNVLRLGLTRLDGLLMRTPTIGPIYENIFRASNTYFQHDTRVVFLALIKNLIEERLRDETSEKGLKLLEIYEHQPILQDFYQKRVTSLNDGELPAT